MYCKQCGKEVMENSVVCPNCGALVRKEKAGIKINWLILGGALASIIATFMPAVSAMGESISFMHETTQTEGIGIIVFSLIIGVLGLFRTAGMFSLIPALVNIYVVYYDLSPVLDYGADLGIGAILIIIANIVCVAGSVMAIIEFVKRKKNLLP